MDVRTVFVNAAEDHRLATDFPTPIQTESVWSDGHFFVNERAIEPPAGEGWSQPPPETVPQQEFSLLSDGKRGLAILNRGLPEAAAQKGPTGGATLGNRRSTVTSRSKKRVKTNHESTEVSQLTCHGCADRQCTVGQLSPGQTIQGTRLVLASVACFLVPLILALVGTALCRFSPTAQLLGATAGLTIGMVGWGLVGRLFEIPEEAA